MMVPVSTRQPDPAPALIAEATKRAGLIWIKAPGSGQPRPAWHVWRQAGARPAAYVLTGPGEQPLPGLADTRRVTVLVPSKESGGLLVSWAAEVRPVEPGSPEWGEVIGLLVAGRLNATRPAGENTRVYRLAPVAGETSDLYRSVAPGPVAGPQPCVSSGAAPGVPPSVSPGAACSSPPPAIVCGGIAIIVEAS